MRVSQCNVCHSTPCCQPLKLRQLIILVWTLKGLNFRSVTIRDVNCNVFSCRFLCRLQGFAGFCRFLASFQSLENQTCKKHCIETTFILTSLSGVSDYILVVLVTYAVFRTSLFTFAPMKHNCGHLCQSIKEYFYLYLLAHLDT